MTKGNPYSLFGGRTVSYPLPKKNISMEIRKMLKDRKKSPFKKSVILHRIITKETEKRTANVFCDVLASAHESDYQKLCRVTRQLSIVVDAQRKGEEEIEGYNSKDLWLNEGLMDFIVEEYLGLSTRDDICWVPSLVLGARYRDFIEKKPVKCIRRKDWFPLCPLNDNDDNNGGDSGGGGGDGNTTDDKGKRKLIILPLIVPVAGTTPNHWVLAAFRIGDTSYKYIDTINDGIDQRAKLLTKFLRLVFDHTPENYQIAMTYQQDQDDDWTCGWRVLRALQVVFSLKYPRIPSAKKFFFFTSVLRMKEEEPYTITDTQYLLDTVSQFRMFAAASMRSLISQKPKKND